VQIVHRAKWLYVKGLTEMEKLDKRVTAGSSQPELPKQLPLHVPLDVSQSSTLPLFRATGATVSKNCQWATSYIAAVAAMMSDAYAAAQGLQREMNFTAQQLQAVSLLQTCALY
jgi:hypothetical protein